MRKTVTLHDRIQLRAYYMHVNGVHGSAVDHWLAAEAIEVALFEKRSASAKKGAATRKRTSTLKAWMVVDTSVRNVAVMH